MRALRSTLGVLLGYVLFAVAAVAFFRALGQAPHQPAPLWITVCSTLYGSTVAFLGAKVAARIAGYNPWAHSVALGAVIATGATVSLVSTIGHGAVWSQVTALLFMAPSAYVAGRRPKRSALPA